MVTEKKIPDALDYTVYSDGRVYSEYTKRFVKPFLAGKYYALKIHGKNRYIHKLVAELFVDGWFAGAEVNHKDEDKLNNNASNLEWFKHKQNCNHGTRNTRAGEKHRKPIASYKDGVLQSVYASLSEAARVTGICISTIGKVANGIGKTAGGYVWRYIAEGA